jgi:hypothetical protein
MQSFQIFRICVHQRFLFYFDPHRHRSVFEDLQTTHARFTFEEQDYVRRVYCVWFRHCFTNLLVVWNKPKAYSFKKILWIRLHRF